MPNTHAGQVRRPRVWPWLVPIVALAAGAIFSSGLRSTQGSTYRSTVTGLPDLIRDEAANNADLSRRVEALTAEVDQLTQEAVPRDAAVAAVASKADALAIAAGTTQVRGPGISVSLDDSRADLSTMPDGITADSLVVHQQDVQAVVNALWSGGAEAMMLMDQRVISTSAVRCVGNTLILKGRVYSPPYVISAIGDRETMARALESSREVQIYREYVTAVGLGYSVTDLGDVTFPAYSGQIAPRFAGVPLP